MLFDHGCEFGIYGVISYAHGKRYPQLEKTYVSLDELEKLIGANDYNDIYSAISALVEDGALKPIKKVNGANGLIPRFLLNIGYADPPNRTSH